MTRKNLRGSGKLSKKRRLAIGEGWCYRHVQAIIVAIDQYADSDWQPDFFPGQAAKRGEQSQGGHLMIPTLVGANVRCFRRPNKFSCYGRP